MASMAINKPNGSVSFIISLRDFPSSEKLLVPGDVLESIASDMPGASFLISYGQVEDVALPEADKARIYRDNARRIIPGV